MNSSGIKRGLAATAVSALAVAGLPFLASSASASPLNQQAAALTLVNTGDLSAKDDGANTTVRLEAIAPATVSAVTFQYSLDGVSFTTIGTATNDNGAFALEWNPSAIAGATGVTIRATATVSGAPVTDDAVVDVNNTLATVNVNDGESVGVFQSPYAANDNFVALGGTKSNPSNAALDQPTVEYYNNVGAWAGTDATTGTAAAGATTGSWASVLDLEGTYTFSSNDQLLVRATEATSGTEDFEAFDLYKQTITTVNATAAATNVPAGSTTNVTVTVLDQNNKPVAGARVKNADNTQTQITDGNGKAVFTQGAGASYYYADATNAVGYNPELGDKQSSTVTVTQYNAVPTQLVASSVDGAAFDVNEYADGQITVQAKDQTGANIDVSDEQDLRYTWTFTPFAAPNTPVVVPVAPATSEQATEAAAGKFEVPIDSSNLPGQQTESGTYVLNASLEANAGGNNAVAASNLLTVKMGDSTLSWTTGDPAQAKAGTTLDATGKLVLEDGTPLAGRNVAVTYNGLGGNAGIVQANGSVAGSRTVATAADGTFSVTVKDPAATPQPEETTGNLSAVTVPGTTDSDDPAEGPAVIQVDFLNDVAPATATIATSAVGTVDVNTDGAANTPGEIQAFDVTVKTADDPATVPDESHAVTNSPVTLTLDHGYFTDGTPAPAPAVGADAGSYKVLGTNDGKTITVNTDGSGVAHVLVAIGKDAGFDDDGAVTTNLTATAGAATKAATKNWSSANPINGGEVQIVESPADRQNGPVDPSPLSNEIVYDVFTTDQFGNRVGGETVALGVDDTDADTSAGAVVSDFDERGDFTVFADRAGTYTVTGAWSTETYKYTVATGNGTPTRTTPPAPGGEVVTGTADAEFYAVDFDASTFTITSDPEGEVPVGTAVTETVTVIDQEGNPVQGLDVQFIRSGPGNQTGDANYTTFTNQNGQAFYSFTGTEAGVAQISAVIDDDVQLKTITDTVSFKAAEPVGLNLQLGKASKGNKDKIKVNANDNGAGLVAKVFRNGKKIASHALNASGDYTFSVTDKNGNKKTKYTVKIAATAGTKAASKSITIK